MQRRGLLLALLLCAACREDAAPEGPLPTEVLPAQASAEAAVPLEIYGERLRPRVRTDFKRKAGSSLDATFTAQLTPAVEGLAAVELLDVTLEREGVLTAVLPAGTPEALYHLTVRDGSGAAGVLEGAFRVVTSAENVAAFQFDPVGPVRARVPFTVGVTAVDASGRTVDGFTGTVTLADAASALSPVLSPPFVAGRLRTQLTFAAPLGGASLLAVDALGHGGQSDAFEVRDGWVTQVAFTSAPQTLAAGACSPALSLETRDSTDARAGVESALDVALAAGPSGGVTFFSDAACTAQVSRVALSVAQSQAQFYLRAVRAGALSIRAAPASLPSAAQLQVVQPNAAVKAVFTTPELTLRKDECSAELRVALQDAFGNEAQAVAVTTAALVAQPAAGVGFFGDKDCTTPLVSLGFNAGESAATLHFRASAEGTVRLTATPDQGLAAASQVQTVVP